MSVPYMEQRKKKFSKKVIIYAFAVLIWCERRKKQKIFLFRLAKSLLQESVVCKEEKYPAFVFKWVFAVEFWCEKKNISFSA